MPQARKQRTEPTEAEKRAQARREAAEKAADGYAARDDEVFEQSRGFVLAQLTIARELETAYEQLLKEREQNREQLRTLVNQGLTTREEAVESYVRYPLRQKSDTAETVAA